MGKTTPLSLFLLLLLANLTAGDRRTYIVHMKPNLKPGNYPTHHDLYSAILDSVRTEAEADSLLYSYSTAFPGFAASLDESQVEALRRSGQVLDVYEDTIYSLHTTRTPEFLGLDSTEFNSFSFPAASDSTRDVIVGVLDTGVWPESKSFDDAGVPAVPARWKGLCQAGPDFSASLCNNKLIGAKFFSKGYRMATGAGSKASKEQESPRDVDGHGTHTASTAAGSPVANASLLGYASGVARGMATHARVSAYKVCWSSGCFGSDILAGMDAAIQDGVDVLSLSLGGGSAPYYRDTLAIGAFAATEKGIFVSCSAGNSGPTRASLANTAPWIMTVGAGTIDRDFPSYVTLGDNRKFTGVSLYSGPGMGPSPVGLVYNKGTNGSSNLCVPGSLDPTFVKGKVVVCDRGINARVEKGEVVKAAGGVGMVLANTAASGEELVADSHLVPAVAVGRKMGDVIREYARKDASPRAVLSFGGTVVNVKPSPVVAAFSSRGPNMVTPQILKPDLIGPGVNILAGWSLAVGPTGLESDTRKTPFNILSGTSMSCPHISGVAALLKANHPSWSPSAIKSALITTAYNVDNTNSSLRDAADGSLSTPWGHGAGHVDPHQALNPGLVYDISTQEYITFLCSLGYAVEHVQAIVKRHGVNCTRKFSDPGQLNYPSFSVVFSGKRIFRYTRELTNVGAAGSVYDVAVSAPSTVGVSVKPTKLAFRNVGDKLSYTVTFVAKKGVKPDADSDFGSITWINAQHQVRSPVAFVWSLI